MFELPRTIAFHVPLAKCNAGSGGENLLFHWIISDKIISGVAELEENGNVLIPPTPIPSWL